jgi:hypothetical protein
MSYLRIDPQNALEHPMLQDIKRLVSWLTQTLIVFLGPTIAFTLLESSTHPGPDTVLSQLFGYAFLAAVSVGLALTVLRINQTFGKEGTWIWVLPIVLEIWGLMSDHFGFVNNYLLITRPGDGEAGLGELLITYPAWSCYWYSAAMWWRLREKQRSVTDAH